MHDPLYQPGEARAADEVAAREPEIIVSPDTRRANRIPPGQSRTRKWPVLDAHGTPNVDLATWELSVEGVVASPLSWSLDEFMQLPTARAQCGFVDAVSNQRVAEQEPAAFTAHQEMRDQRGTVVRGSLKQVAQRLEREALAEHGRRLHRLLVGRIEAVEPGMHQRLDRAGQIFQSRFLGVEHPLPGASDGRRVLVEDAVVQAGDHAGSVACAGFCNGGRVNRFDRGLERPEDHIPALRDYMETVRP